MAIMDQNFEHDLMKIWTLVVDLSDQLSHTKGVVDNLRCQSMILKAQALHTETGFVLRRFNLHLSQEEYDSELERMNNALSLENQGLQYDNKQLNSLLKEYEQTLDSVMSTFRKRAHDVQLQELETIKLYEQLLISSETASLDTQLAADSSVSVLIAQCSRLLRMVLRLMGGEDPTPPSAPLTPPLSPIHGPEASEKSEARFSPELAEPVRQDWALERETELARHEQENRELRMLLQAANEIATTPGSLPPAFPKVPVSAIRSLMPRRAHLRQHSSFSPASTSTEFQADQYHGQGDHSGLLDISDQVL